MDIYIARGEERKGPYSEDSIRQFLADGQLDGTELAWHKGLESWINIGALAKEISAQRDVSRRLPEVKAFGNNKTFAFTTVGILMLLIVSAASLIIVSRQAEGNPAKIQVQALTDVTDHHAIDEQAKLQEHRQPEPSYPILAGGVHPLKIHSTGNRQADPVEEHPDPYDKGAKAISRRIRAACHKPTGDLTQDDLDKVKQLLLIGSQIDDLRPLAELKNLRILNLGNNQITNLSPLAGLNNLEQLWLWDNKISELPPLAGLHQLKWLFINGNQITDLDSLKDFKELRIIFLKDNPNLTKAEIAKLQKALPRCFISHDFN